MTKFKAWNNIENAWENGEFGEVLIGLDGKAVVYAESEMWYGWNNSLDIFEYTPFKDKFGVELAQGDIVLYKDSSGSYLGVITKGIFNWSIEIPYPTLSVPFYTFCDERTMTASCQVVGNICEHKHLLGNTYTQHA